MTPCSEGSSCQDRISDMITSSSDTVEGDDDRREDVCKQDNEERITHGELSKLSIALSEIRDMDLPLKPQAKTLTTK